MLDETLSKKYAHLQEIIRQFERVVVAFSGGVDSSFLLKTAFDVLGHNVIAFQACSSLQTKEETSRGKDIAKHIGAQLKLFTIDPLSWPVFVSNPPDRCYHCKKEIYTLFKSQLTDDAVQLLDGTNTDDLLDGRPGLRAIHEFAVTMPLVEAGLTKSEIRILSKYLNLPTWDQLSSSCLATRIPFGTPITREILESVSRCESYLHSLNFLGCRVRLQGDSAKIELAEGDIERFVTLPIRENVKNFFCSVGFNKVFLDLSERNTK